MHKHSYVSTDAHVTNHAIAHKLWHHSCIHVSMTKRVIYV